MPLPALWPLALLVAAVLLIFSLRRLAFLLALWLPRRSPAPAPVELPTVLVAAPCRDEAPALPGLIAALEALDYPPEKLAVALIDDGSRDDTRAVMKAHTEGRERWHLVASDVNRGKARALNAALAQVPFGEIVYVFDADHRPRPDCLRRAATAFADRRVAGVSGRTLPANALVSATAYYCAVEGLVHQAVTMRAKDRLGLAPALLGSNCGYRRSALEEVGGFKPDALLEDSDLTLAFYRRGHLVRFVPEAVSVHEVPQTVRDYWRQHVRWATGFADVARDHARGLLSPESRPSNESATSLPLRLRLELFLFSLGYLDRLAWLAAGAMLIADALRPNTFGFPVWVLVIALALPLLQILGALAVERAEAGMLIRLPIVPAFFALDLLVAVAAWRRALTRRARAWPHTRRYTASGDGPRQSNPP